MTEYTGTDTLHYAVNHSALSGSIAPFEHNCDLCTSGSYPLLHLDQVRLKFSQFPLVFFVFKFICLFIGLFLILLVRHLRLHMTTLDGDIESDMRSLQVIGCIR
jgi:hypothetical protein